MLDWGYNNPEICKSYDTPTKIISISWVKMYNSVANYTVLTLMDTIILMKSAIWLQILSQYNRMP